MATSYKIYGIFEEECAQIVPGPVDTYNNQTFIDHQQQWQPPYSPYSSTTSCYDNGNLSDGWSDFGGSPCPTSSGSGSDDFGLSCLDDGSVPQQAYTFNGHPVKSEPVTSEPVTLLGCLKAPLLTPDQYVTMHHQQKLAHQEDARVKMEETSRLAMKIAYGDVSAACRALCISPDPTTWSVKNTREWLMWTCQQYKECGLSVSQLDRNLFQLDGHALTQMTEDDFKAIHYGELLLWALEIWKGASQALKMEQEMSDCQYMQQEMSPVGGEVYGGSAHFDAFANAGGHQNNQNNMFCYGALSVSSPDSIPDSGLDGCGSEDGDNEGFETPTNGTTTSHTHLWQFLKEMLANPRFKSAIRWTDRSQGIFKIDDSGLVARKWGERKHRPAMNYDKLSRSIRQYYKKGIMKKTTRSQRLVYQFCSHYAN